MTKPLPLLCRVILPSLWLSCTLVQAQEQVVAKEDANTEQAMLFGELPSVFTASRHEQQITKAPAAVDIITAEQIKLQGWRTVAAMLGSLPGFLNTYDRAYEHVGVRGFAPPGDYNTRLLVLVDGHRINEGLQDYAGLGRDFLVDIENIERVEVVRGPASALYGSSAAFGVVNVITQRGRDLQGTQLAGEIASFDAHRGQIRYGKKFSSGIETLFSASHYHSDGHENLHFPGLGTAQNLDAEEVQRLFGKVAWGDFTLSGGWMGRKKFLPTGTAGAAFSLADTNYHDRRAYADLNYYHRFAGDWAVTGRLFWDSYQFDDTLPHLHTEQTRIVNRDLWLGEWFGGELLLSHTFFDSHLLTWGLEFRRNYQQRMANEDVVPYVVYANNQQTSNIFGLYAQDEWSLAENLQFQAGVRWDHYDSFGGTLNPRLGLIYQPFTDTSLKLLYGRAFRAPNTFETEYNCCAEDIQWVGNAQLKPEKIETYEIVLEQRLNEYLNLRISPFYNRMSNLIGLGRINDAAQQFYNQGVSEANGVEVQFKGNYQNIDGRLSYTYQQSEIGWNPNPPNAPKHMAKFNANTPLWAEKLFAGVEVQYVSRRATAAGNSAGNYILTNLVLFSRHLVQGLELTGGLYNVFDTHYVDPASPPLLPDTIMQDGRNLRLRVSLAF